MWLARHDQELELESAARKKGRPKSIKVTNLEDIKAVESETYRTGMGVYCVLPVPASSCLIDLLPEVPDLTHPVNVTLFRQWDQTDLQYVQQLRHIRIFSQQPQQSVVTLPGQHPFLNPKDNMVVDLS